MPTFSILQYMGLQKDRIYSAAIFETRRKKGGGGVDLFIPLALIRPPK